MQEACEQKMFVTFPEPILLLMHAKESLLEENFIKHSLDTKNLEKIRSMIHGLRSNESKFEKAESTVVTQ